jgi:hypothetical protein
MRQLTYARIWGEARPAPASGASIGMENGFTIRRIHPLRNYTILVCVLALIVGGIFGVQGMQAAQAAQAQAQSLKVSQAKLVAAKASAKVTAARADVTAAIGAATPALAAAAGKIVPADLNVAINSAKTMLALQEDDLAKLAAVAASIKKAAEGVPAAIAAFETQQAAAQAAQAAAQAAQAAAKQNAQQVATEKAQRVKQTVRVPQQPAPQRTEQVAPHPLRQSTAPKLSVPLTVDELLAKSQAALDQFGGGDQVVLDKAFAVTGSCRAHAHLGLPEVTYEYCYLNLSDRAMHDLMAHEWVHTKTSPRAVLPVELSPTGINAPEMVADCYAMARLGTGPTPGGYMQSCTPEQTAAAIAVIEHPTDNHGLPLESLLP